MNVHRLARHRFALGLLALAAAALALRIAPGAAQVFVGAGAEGVVLREIDPWYHLRAIEHQVANFPERFRFDPYLRHPAGDDVPLAPLLDGLVAGAALAIGWRAPTPRQVAVTAALASPVLAALTLWPVAALARRRWGEAAALLAAAAVALLPGQFLARSLLGFVDHHVLEVLLSTLLLATLTAGLTSAEASRERRAWGIAAGLALGLYLLAWVGGAALMLLLAGWIAAQYATDVARDRPLGWLSELALPTAGIAFGMVALAFDGITVPRRNLFAAGAVLVGTLALWGIARAARATAHRRLLALALPLLGAAGAALALAALAPALRSELAVDLARVLPGQGAATRVTEMAPVAALGPLWSTLWREFGVAGFLLPLAAVGWLWGGLARGRREDLLLALWMAGLAGFTWGQNRFLYYLVVPAALAAAWAVARTLDLVSDRAEGTHRRLGRSLIVAGVAALFLLPGLPAAIERAAEPPALDADWRAALSWLRSATPEPFTDPAAYRRALRRDDPQAPRSSYGVAAWWDYGYWILERARRVPIANPTQAGAVEVARLLLATDDAAALAASHRLGAGYLVLDDELPLLVRRDSARASGKVRAIAEWAGERPERYVERVLARSAAGPSAARTLFYPEYYRTLLVRLYLFAGRGYAPRGPAYVAELAAGAAGTPPEMVRLGEHPSLAAASAWLVGRDPARFRLVGLDPAVPCVPLPASPAWVRRFSSPTAALLRDGEPVGKVVIFEIGAEDRGGPAP